MKICAVICELNPLHNGHEYIFQQAKLKSGCDYVLAIMSGNFCQRVDPAIINEYRRTEAALNCGADIVIELPVIYATASGDKFAEGAIGILNTIPNITHLVMGSEYDGKAILETLGNIQAEEPQAYTDALRAALSAGKSYARAVTEATASAAENYGHQKAVVSEILNKPNNILAVAYKKHLVLSQSKMEFLSAKRIDEYMSASSIRENIDAKKVLKAMPRVSYDITVNALKTETVNQNEFAALMLHAVRCAAPEQIAAVPDCNEGLEHKIKKAALSATDYNELLKLCTSARYTTGRIKRICLHNLLKITKNMQNSGYIHSRVLGIKENCTKLLSIMPDNILKNTSEMKDTQENIAEVMQTDISACSLYSTISHNTSCDYIKKLIKI